MRALKNHPTAASAHAKACWENASYSVAFIIPAPRSPPLPFRQAAGSLPIHTRCPHRLRRLTWVSALIRRSMSPHFNARPVAGHEYHNAFRLSSPCGVLPRCQSIDVIAWARALIAHLLLWLAEVPMCPGNGKNVLDGSDMKLSRFTGGAGIYPLNLFHTQTPVL